MKRTIWAAGLLVFASSAMGAEIRTSFGGSRSPSGGSKSSSQPSGPAQAPTTNPASRSQSSFTRAHTGRSSSSFGQFQSRRLSVRRAGADPETTSGPAPQVGALVQSWHPTKVGPENPQVLHIVDGGSDFMHPEGDKTQALNPYPGVRMGKSDTPPSSGSGGASGKNAITAIPNPDEK